VRNCRLLLDSSWTSIATPSIVRPIVVVIIANTLWAGSATAQSVSPNSVFGRYQQVHWQERDGLPQNTILAITTTRDGYLWAGTYEGAARFDGVRFTPFNPSNTTGFGNALVYSILERRNGELWFATYGGGVSRFADGRFTQFTMREGLSSDYTTCLREDRAGTLWIGTVGGGVDRYHDGRFTAFTMENGLPSDIVRGLVEEDEGVMLVGTSRGIARIADGRVTTYPVAQVASLDIRTLARAADGSLWVAAMTGGLYRVQGRVVTDFGPRHGLANNIVESLYAGADGVVWVGTTGAGLFRYADGRFEPYTTADGLPGGRVPTIAPGIDGAVWVGTDGGLVRLRPRRLTVHTTRDGLADDYIGDILEDASGSAWIETSGRLNRFTRGAFAIVTARDGLPDDSVRGLARGFDGFPLVYMQSSGLFRWTRERDRFVAVDTPADIPWDRAYAVIEDRFRTLWIAIDDGGLLRVRDGQITHFSKQDGLGDDSVISLFEDRAGQIWVGTLRHGVTRIARDGRMTTWTTQNGLAANHVMSFHEDASGALWIGTHGGGLTRVKGGQVASVSARQGLYNDKVFQILEDDDGNLWMNCNMGIWRTALRQLNEVADGRRATVDSVAYDTSDGMLSADGVGTHLAGWRMRDGALWFSTTKGIVVIDPRRRDSAPSRVLIEGVTIDREPAAIDAPIRLTPEQRNLEISFTGLSWSRAPAIKFRFRLTPLDRDWVDAGTRRTAYYSYLPPGSYTFNVTADNGEGVWNETVQTLAVVVLPRFYQTWWFRVAAASSLIALVWLSWRYRIAQMRRAQVAQQAFSRQLIESQERERQRIAAELHDSLGQNLLIVKNRAQLGVLSQPDEQALKQFNEIGVTVAQTLEEVRTISYNLRPHHLDQLGLTTTIGAMVDKIAESSSIRISSELDDIDGVFAPADEITIYRIIQESLNNVVKHSRAGEAHVVVRSRERDVEITIRDNGQGFVPRASNAGAADRGGFGLTGIAQRVDMLGGTHTIESSPGSGTTVTVRLAHRSLGEGGIGAGTQTRETQRGE
jgi:signal transduction histidine kinase/ligand-binding sensor domain-containing protein